jgi:hypothetical protein
MIVRSSSWMTPVGRELPSRDPLEYDDVDPLDDPELCFDAPQCALDAV